VSIYVFCFFLALVFFRTLHVTVSDAGNVLLLGWGLPPGAVGIPKQQFLVEDCSCLLPKFPDFDISGRCLNSNQLYHMQDTNIHRH
jgi:hypothetical protein